MEEKRDIKIRLSTLILILLIAIIAIMAVFVYKLYNEKIMENEKTAELEKQVSHLNAILSDLQEEISEETNITKLNEVNTSNIDDKANDSETSSNKQLSTEESIKEAFLEKIKDMAKENNLADYRIDNVEVLSNSESQYIIDNDNGEYYQAGDILAKVKYSVKPKDEKSYSNWMAGNGSESGEWIINKITCVCFRNGKIVNSGTGW